MTNSGGFDGWVRWERLPATVGVSASGPMSPSQVSLCLRREICTYAVLALIRTRLGIPLESAQRPDLQGVEANTVRHRLGGQGREEDEPSSGSASRQCWSGLAGWDLRGGRGP